MNIIKGNSLIINPSAYFHDCIMRGDITGVNLLRNIVENHYFKDLHSIHVLALASFVNNNVVYKQLVDLLATCFEGDLKTKKDIKFKLGYYKKNIRSDKRLMMINSFKTDIITSKKKIKNVICTTDQYGFVLCLLHICKKHKLDTSNLYYLFSKLIDKKLGINKEITPSAPPIYGIDALNEVNWT